MIRLSNNQRERLARESRDERDARLDRTSANRRERLARESQDERDTRLDRTSTNQRERLAVKYLSEDGTSLLKIPLLLYHNTCVGFMEARPETSSLVIIIVTVSIYGKSSLGRPVQKFCLK